MSARLLYIAEYPVEAIEELSRIVLKRSVQADESGQPLQAGSAGTIVSVLANGAAYLVEFTDPFEALVEVIADDFDVIPGERRGDRSTRQSGERLLKRYGGVLFAMARRGFLLPLAGEG